MSEKYLHQFKKLQNVGPSLEWKENTRNFLINQVKRDTLTQETSWVNNFPFNFYIFFRNLAPSPVRSIAAFLVIVLIGGTGIFAKASYNPKSPLYPVKITLEKIDLVLAFTAKSEARKYLIHANNRKEEALKLAKESGYSSAEKEEGISAILKSMEKNISAAQSSLSIIQENKDKSTETLELAKEISEKANESLKDLDEVKDIISLKGVKNSVAEAKSAIEKAEDVSLEVLIKEANGAEKTLVISQDELKTLINHKLERTVEKTEALKQIIAKVDLNQVIIAQEITQGTTKISIQLNIQEVVSEAKGMINQAEAALIIAQESLNKEEFTLTLNKIKEASEAIQKAKDVLVKVESPEELEGTGEDIAEPVDNSNQPTTTPSDNFQKVEGATEEIILPSSTVETTPEIIK